MQLVLCGERRRNAAPLRSLVVRSLPYGATSSNVSTDIVLWSCERRVKK
jgi:hypothetical protein